MKNARIKKVLLIGSSLRLGRTEEVYLYGFEQAGWEVAVCMLEEIVDRPRKPSMLTRMAWRLAASSMLQPFNRRVVQLARRTAPDLVFVVSPRLLSPRTVAHLKQWAPVFVFFTDNPLDQHHTHRSRWQDECLPLWDVALIWSRALARELLRRGVKQAAFHAFASDDRYLFPQTNADVLYDVAFVANWDGSGKREMFLEAISDRGLAIWGTKDWIRRPSYDLKRSYKGTNSYADMSRLFGSARLALNIMRPQNMCGHNLRNYEIAACGALMLSERTPELPRLFREDEEAVYFSSPQELREKVEWLLREPEVAGRIAANGFAKSKKNGIAARIREIDRLLTEGQGSEAGLSRQVYNSDHIVSL